MGERRSAAQAARFGILGACVVALLASGCVVHHYHENAPVIVQEGGHGPPAHAPAHGYRRKHPHDSVELVFDGDLGVYVVVGRPGVYWHGDRYLVWRDGLWRASARIDGVWVSIGNDEVPVQLVAKYSDDGHHGKKARGHSHKLHYPAKHAY